MSLLSLLASGRVAPARVERRIGVCLEAGSVRSGNQRLGLVSERAFAAGAVGGRAWRRAAGALSPRDGREAGHARDQERRAAFLATFDARPYQEPGSFA